MNVELQTNGEAWDAFVAANPRASNFTAGIVASRRGNPLPQTLLLGRGGRRRNPGSSAACVDKEPLLRPVIRFRPIFQRRRRSGGQRRCQSGTDASQALLKSAIELGTELRVGILSYVNERTLNW